MLAWHRARTPVERGRLALRALWMPVHAWSEAAEAVTRFGPEVQAAASLSPRAQRRQLWRLSVRHGMDAISYIDYQLYVPERRQRAAEYLQESEHTRVVRWYNLRHQDSDAAVLRNKSRFHEWCGTHGFPSVPTLLEFDNGEIVASALPGDPAEALPDSDLFSKPVDATGGHGTAWWRYAGGADRNRTWTGMDRRTRSARELLAELAQTSMTLPLRDYRTSRRMLLQPCLRNHRDLLRLSSGALTTIRILTYRAPGERARVVLATYRLVIGDAPADNFHFGGMMAPVDLATGRLGVAVRRQGSILVYVAQHPDTGAMIAGHELPFWPEASRLQRAPSTPRAGCQCWAGTSRSPTTGRCSSKRTPPPIPTSRRPRQAHR